MLTAELKTKLRSLKKIEKRVRARYLHIHQDSPLIWDSYFSTTDLLRKKRPVKYLLDTLLNFDRVERKRVFEEYLYAVFVQHHREEGMLLTMFHDPEILAFFELPPHATLLEIKKRFRQLAHEYHPDKGGDPEKMIQLLELYSQINLTI